MPNPFAPLALNFCLIWTFSPSLLALCACLVLCTWIIHYCCTTATIIEPLKLQSTVYQQNLVLLQYSECQSYNLVLLQLSVCKTHNSRQKWNHNTRTRAWSHPSEPLYSCLIPYISFQCLFLSFVYLRGFEIPFVWPLLGCSGLKELRRRALSQKAQTMPGEVVEGGPGPQICKTTVRPKFRFHQTYYEESAL